MERRVLLAIFLCFLVLYVWQSVFAPQPKPAPTPGPSTAAATATPSPVPAGPQATAAESPAPGATTLVGEPTERDIRIETRDVIATFTNRGARLKSWRLKGYLDERREPLELVATDLIDTHPLPFSLRAGDEATTKILNGALYAVTGIPAAGGPASTTTQVRFEYRDSAGIEAVKEFGLEPVSFVVSFRASVTQNGGALPVAVQWGPALGSGRTASSWVSAAEGILSTGDDVERLQSDDIASQPAYEGSYRYAGVDDHYFMTVVLDPGPARVSYQPVSIPPPAGTDEKERTFVAYTIEPASAGAPLKFFAGPKDFDQLAMVDRDLVRAINFGIFSVIVVPLLRSLKWVNGFVGNYGWSIVILTVLINAVMFPLRHKSVVSMRKMQEIQPEAKAIQDRYAKLKSTDPAKQKMNQELMALYRERGVNPAGGCIPMLLTMPVLFAFYALLTVAIELRGAPFFGWIHDLSLPDPYFVTPVLMGASQFWQTWLTPQTGADPAQQKMMMFMPLIFMVFSLWFPAGVALYWLVSNVWGIGQTYLTNYLIGPPNVRSIRPPAERRMKRVGSSRTEAAAKEN